LFDDLCKSVGNGPVYLESSKFEEREGNLKLALNVCE